MNKKTIITALLAFVTIAGYAGSNKITNRTDGSITFVVDENLTPFDNPFMRLYTGESQKMHSVLLLRVFLMKITLGTWGRMLSTDVLSMPMQITNQ